MAAAGRTPLESHDTLRSSARQRALRSRRQLSLKRALYVSLVSRVPWLPLYPVVWWLTHASISFGAAFVPNGCLWLQAPCCSGQATQPSVGGLAGAVVALWQCRVFETLWTSLSAGEKSSSTTNMIGRIRKKLPVDWVLPQKAADLFYAERLSKISNELLTKEISLK
jgi:hypothetical protein